MSDYSDDALDRYLARNAESRRAYLEDPVQHAQAELLRQALRTADRAMADERVPEEARNRVVNRMVWGDPAGLIDVHGQRNDQVIAVAAPPVGEYRLSSHTPVVGGGS